MTQQVSLAQGEFCTWSDGKVASNIKPFDQLKLVSFQTAMFCVLSTETRWIGENLDHVSLRSSG